MNSFYRVFGYEREFLAIKTMARNSHSHFRTVYTLTSLGFSYKMWAWNLGSFMVDLIHGCQPFPRIGHLCRRITCRSDKGRSKIWTEPWPPDPYYWEGVHVLNRTRPDNS